MKRYTSPIYLDKAMRYASFFASALKRVTGENLFKYVPANIMDPLIYMVYETGRFGGSFHAPEFGDHIGGMAFPQLYSVLTRYKRCEQAQWLFKKLTYGGRFFDVHSLLWHDDTVPAGPPTDKWARHFRGIGQVVLRSGWGLRENFLAIKYHQNRGHHDLGTFDLYALGEKLIVDSGKAGYGTAIHRDFLRWTEAHNVVMVDGLRQIRTDGRVLDFMKIPTYAYTVGDLTPAYENIINKWHRHVLFLYPDYWVMIDELRSDDLHKYEWLVHPMESFRVNPHNVTLTTGEVSLLIKMAQPEKTKVTIHDGYLRTTPREFLRIAPEGLHRNMNFVTLLYPYWTAFGGPDFQVIRKDNMKGFKIEREAGRDIIIHSAENNIGYNDLVSDGRIVVVSRNNQGEISRFALHQGKSLQDGRRTLLSSTASVMSAGMSYNPGLAKGSVRLAQSGRISLYSPFRARTVFVNGRKEKFSFDKGENLVTLALPQGKHRIVITEERTETVPVFKVERVRKVLPPAPPVELVCPLEKLKIDKLGGVDLSAQVKRVTASSVRGRTAMPAEEVLNNDPGKRFDAWRFWSTDDPTPPHWLVIELKEPKKISTVVVWHHLRPDVITSDYLVQTWNEIEGKWITQDDIKGNTRDVVVSTFPEVTTGKIRLYITKANPTDGHARIGIVAWD